MVIICYFTADTCSKFSHLEGRKVVDLPFVISLLEKGCTVCHHKLRLSNCMGEEKYGLASVLEIKCSTCGMLTKIGTSDTHTPAGGSNRGRRPYDVNTKAAFATMVSGIGITQANRFLAVLNIPQMTHRNSKKREREIGAVVERPANQSCMEACAIERHLTRSSNESPELQDPRALSTTGLIFPLPYWTRQHYQNMQQRLLVQILNPNWTRQQWENQRHQQAQIPNLYWTRQERENQRHQRVQITECLSLQAMTMAGQSVVGDEQLCRSRCYDWPPLV